jgi:hypothetical protein
LRVWDIPDSPQNLEPQELARKIFRDKELAAEDISRFELAEPALVDDAVAGNWLAEVSRISSSLRFSTVFSKGCSSQEVEFFLWKAVEKGWRTARLFPACHPLDFNLRGLSMRS